MEGGIIMITKEMEEALNNQLNVEFYSSYLYLSMSAYFKNQNLSGFASWMQVQAQEELTHAMKVYNFIIERGGMVELKKVNEPKKEWKSPKDVFQDSLSHERGISEKINNLISLSNEKKDNATNIFLQWFVTEQVEEEATADEILKKLELIGDNTGGLFMLDRELAQRAFKQV